MRVWKVLFLSAFALSSGLNLSGCLFSGLNKDSDAVMYKLAGGDGAGGQEFFAQVVHPLILQAQCSACHGKAQSPLFAVADVAAAYSVAKGLVNFDQPDQSKLGIKAVDNHYGSQAQNLGAGPWNDAIKRWVEAEKAAGSASSSSTSEIVSPAFTIPFPLGTPNPRDFTLPLDSMGPDYNQVSLVFRIEEGNPQGTGFKLAGSFMLNNLRIQNSSGRAFDLAEIKVYQDGIFTPGIHDSFINVGSLVAPNTNLIISSNYMLLDSTAGLTIRFAFKKFSVTTFNGCQQLPLFVSQVRAAVMVPQCVSCHGANGNAAASKFSMRATDTDATVCAKALQNSNLTTPANSNLLRNPCNGQNGHQLVPGFCNDTNKVNGVLNWIAQE